MDREQMRAAGAHHSEMTPSLASLWPSDMLASTLAGPLSSESTTSSCNKGSSEQPRVGPHCWPLWLSPPPQKDQAQRYRTACPLSHSPAASAQCCSGRTQETGSQQRTLCSPRQGHLGDCSAPPPPPSLRSPQEEMQGSLYSFLPALEQRTPPEAAQTGETRGWGLSGGDSHSLTPPQSCSLLGTQRLGTWRGPTWAAVLLLPRRRGHRPPLAPGHRSSRATATCSTQTDSPGLCLHASVIHALPVHWTQALSRHWTLGDCAPHPTPTVQYCPSVLRQRPCWHRAWSVPHGCALQL